MMSNEVVDIVRDAVMAVSGKVEIAVTDYNACQESCMPEVTYVFGSAEYFKDYLDEHRPMPLPVIVLFCPVDEQRDISGHDSKAKLNLLIACGTCREFSNEQRRDWSFRNQLRPLYNAFLDALRSDSRLDFGYDGKIPHRYSENYSYGKYGAYVNRSGEMVSVPIDAIDIRDLEIKINNISCR